MSKIIVPERRLVARREERRLVTPRRAGPHKLVHARPTRIPMPRARLAMRGEFKLEAVHKFSGKRRLLADWFPNLITDQGLNYWGNSNLHWATCCVGTGNTAPAQSDTQLATEIATTTNVQSSTGSAEPSAPYHGSRVKTYRFAQGDAEGNVAEIGVGPSGGSPIAVYSRALILDSGGSPTTVTVQADEFLDATYRHELYPVIPDASYTIDISGSSYDVVRRPASVDSAGRWQQESNPSQIIFEDLGFGFRGLYTYPASSTLGAITDDPSGSGSNTDGGVSYDSYVADSFERTVSSTWGLNENNETGGIGVIRADLHEDFGSYQLSFDPAIPKDNTQILTLEWTLAWGRFVST